jgi:hypothetical protein
MRYASSRIGAYLSIFLNRASQAREAFPMCATLAWSDPVHAAVLVQ